MYAELIAAATQKNTTIAFVTAGGGADLYRLFSVPGASAVMAEARMLYNAHSFETFFDYTVTEKFVSREMAELLAKRLRELTGASLTLSLTCAFTTNRVRKGKDRGHAALCHNGNMVFHREMEAQGETREDQDGAMSREITALVLEYIKGLP